MSLDEKIGQICELTIDVIQNRDGNSAGFVLDEALLDSVIGKYKVGSILNVPCGVAQDTAMWHNLIRRIQEKSLATMGIPCVYGVDQIHGTTYTLGGTLFPQGINMGATFNRSLTRRVPKSAHMRHAPQAFRGLMRRSPTSDATRVGLECGKTMAKTPISTPKWAARVCSDFKATLPTI